MKEMFIVRYADDFKILCRNKNDAGRVFYAVKQWLKDRLKLDINEEKLKVTNITKKYTEFLGFKFKAKNKRNKKVIESHMTDKAKKKFIEDVQKQIAKIKEHPSTPTVNRYNAMVMGKQNYYEIATIVNVDMAKIAFLASKRLKNRIKGIESKVGIKSEVYKQRYGKHNIKAHYIAGIALFPIAAIQHIKPMCFTNRKCNYTEAGREEIHDNLKGYDKRIIKYIMKNTIIKYRTTEYPYMLDNVGNVQLQKQNCK